MLGYIDCVREETGNALSFPKPSLEEIQTDAMAAVVYAAVHFKTLLSVAKEYYGLTDIAEILNRAARDYNGDTYNEGAELTRDRYARLVSGYAWDFANYEGGGIALPPLPEMIDRPSSTQSSSVEGKNAGLCPQQDPVQLCEAIKDNFGEKTRFYDTCQNGGTGALLRCNGEAKKWVLCHGGCRSMGHLVNDLCEAEGGEDDCTAKSDFDVVFTHYGRQNTGQMQPGRVDLYDRPDRGGKVVATLPFGQTAKVLVVSYFGLPVPKPECSPDQYAVFSDGIERSTRWYRILPADPTQVNYLVANPEKTAWSLWASEVNAQLPGYLPPATCQ